jgi:ABC-2 type transport system ATP-binding protein
MGCRRPGRRLPQMSTIEIRSVHKRFGSTRALRGVRFESESGVIGLLGPNGAGKTTLLRMAATVLAPDRGSLRLLDGDPQRSSDRVEIRRRLGYMPQEPGFHRNFTAAEFLDYVAVLKEWTDRTLRADEVARVLGLVDLTDVAGMKIRQLSGGMRRRVALAQALIGEPDLLVLDEPTAGLDPQQRLRFRELISQIAERQTVLLSTHQTQDVSALCEQVVVIDRGQILFDGRPSDLAEHARGCVWVATERDDRARLSWRTGEGHHRHIGEAPSGASLIEPTIEDGYLLLAGESARADLAA